MNKNDGSRRRLPRPATVLAAIAVFAVLAGTATAADTLITGKQIKKGTITGKQIKNKSLTANKFTTAALNQLRGNQGPRGERGPQGERGLQGEKGAQGPAGIVAPLYGEKGSQNIAADAEATVLTVPVASAGKFLINAKLNLFQVAAGDVGCFLVAGNNQVDDVSWTNDEVNGRQSLSLLAVATATPADPIELGCGFDDSNGSVSEVHLSAVPVS
ncbi:MAG TPA: hypothetical protein VEW07_14140 [Solirubrobacterales bacterium]|nr:hypothetical protein [Solirubrobacterales bacterium]